MQTGSGRFIGVNGHEMTGAFRLVHTSAGCVLETCLEFYFDAKAPNPVWGLGDNAGRRLAGTEFARIQPFSPLRGRQSLEIPDAIITSPPEAIVVWCTTLRIELGVGLIQSSTSDAT